MGINLNDYGKITQGYKNKRAGYALGYHTGVDIVLTNKTIKSFTNGIVSKKGYMSSYGNYVVVQSDDGFYCWYCHMANNSPVAIGQTVEAGKTILGTMGSSGNSSGPHLHFEVRSNRDNQKTNIDPVAYLKNGSGINSNAIDTSTPQGQVYVFLVGQLGLNTAAACGIMANIEKESGFNVDCHQVGGNAYGLIQWDGSRKTALFDYCKSNGLSYKTIDGQMAFLKYELNNDSNTYNRLKSVSNDEAGAYQAGYDFCYYFERPKNKQSRAVERGNLAKEYFQKYQNGGLYNGSDAGGNSSMDGFFDKLSNGIDYVKINWKSLLVRIVLIILAVALVLAAFKKGFLD